MTRNGDRLMMSGITAFLKGPGGEEQPTVAE
jgi:hypothetical protein